MFYLTEIDSELTKLCRLVHYVNIKTLVAAKHFAVGSLEVSGGIISL